MMVAYRKKILGASLGNCVHVAGILGFLKLAGEHGFETRFLGPAVSLDKLGKGIKQHHPDMIAVSYRLTPEVLGKLLGALKDQIGKNGWQDRSFVFGGTPPAAEVARRSRIFDAVFSGAEPQEEIIAFLEGKLAVDKKSEILPQSLMDRIAYKAPYPLLRHHFGQPTVARTLKGAKEIALSGTIDVLSLGPDQNAQESLFRPLEMKKGHDGAGGVPLRKPEELEEIYRATRCGNYPLLRCYSGTRDLIKWAEMLKKTINNAWGAVPLFWYNLLDGRSNRIPVDSIRENQEAMQWYAEQNIPLEANESHHWSLREAPDTVAVAAAFLASYNAKKMGVKHYVAQYMFNTPKRTSPPMDLGKMMAKIELIESLHDADFISIRQTRTGLASLSLDPYVAKGELSASTFYQLALSPKIVHIVGFCEADHAATPSDIIESARIVQGVIEKHFLDLFSLTEEERVRNHKDHLVAEAKLLLEAIRKLPSRSVDDAWTDPENLAHSVKVGLLDAPHLCGNPHAAGKVFTQIRNGACVAVDIDSGQVLGEQERIERILKLI